jgi:hypothetical protein
MLLKILSGLAVASLLVGVIVGVFWWRSYHHTDEFKLGNLDSNQTVFTTHDGRISIAVSENIGGMISTQLKFYPFSQVIWGCFIIPGFWLAIWVRKKLPRPGGRERLPLQRD